MEGRKIEIVLLSLLSVRFFKNFDIKESCLMYEIHEDIGREVLVVFLNVLKKTLNEEFYFVYETKNTTYYELRCLTDKKFVSRTIGGIKEYFRSDDKISEENLT